MMKIVILLFVLELIYSSCSRPLDHEEKYQNLTKKIESLGINLEGKNIITFIPYYGCEGCIKMSVEDLSNVLSEFDGINLYCVYSNRDHERLFYESKNINIVLDKADEYSKLDLENNSYPTSFLIIDSEVIKYHNYHELKRIPFTNWLQIIEN